MNNAALPTGGSSWKFFQKAIIPDRDHPNLDYLVRWYLVETPWFGIKLHKILLSDKGDYHDHPWSFLSIKLKGSYREQRMWANSGLQWTALPRRVTFNAATNLHKVRLTNERPCWTLVLTGPRRRVWGFQSTHGKWYPWTDYQGHHARIVK